jgi:Ser/Thr protein kinase RdoA (MazF antagonist)
VPHTDEQLTTTAERALQSWELDITKLTLVSRSENVVFKVEQKTKPNYALRLHRPGYNTLNELNAECAWTDALNQAGVRTPGNRKTTSNKHYAQVALAETDEELQVGLIEWFDGASLGSLIQDADDDAMFDYFRQFGTIIAQSHNQAVAWKPPAGFTRRRWDADGLMGENPLWGQFWLAPQLNAAQAALLMATRAKIHARLTDYGESEGESEAGFSLIHADLHPWNLLVDDTGIILIDFDDCGYSWHLYDIAVALYNYRDHTQFAEIRDALIEGYRALRPTGGLTLDLLPMFFLIRSLVWLGWINGRPELLDDTQVQIHTQVVCDTAQAFMDNK